MCELTIRFLTAVLLLHTLGCGGGTTGTSPTNDLRFSGTVHDERGTAVSSTDMNVISAKTGEILVASSTDQLGAFSMTLPSSERVLQVELPSEDGERTRSIRVVRKIQSPSTLRAVLEVAPDSSVRRLLQEEVRVVSARCFGASVSPYEIDISAVPTGITDCKVEIEFATERADGVSPPETPTGRIEGSCGGASIPQILHGFPAPNGSIEVDLASILGSTCGNLRIVISGGVEDAMGAVIPLIR